MVKGSLHIDRNIGRQLRIARMQAGLSQQQLGDRVGLTFQQIQKYESGKSRISAGILAVFSRELNVPLTFFFGGADGRAAADSDGFVERPLLELSRLHARLSERRRRFLIEFAKMLAEEDDAAGETEHDLLSGRGPRGGIALS
jgi:transcriptional regulator with XRE-family HTH domain